MTSLPKIALVAMPLMARSGVYRSTHDLVAASQDLPGPNWTALIGLRDSAVGDPVRTLGVREVAVTCHGRAVVTEIRRLLQSSPEVAEADVVVSLIPQCDVALAELAPKHGKPWVAWVRGMPWPARGEQDALRTWLLRLIETRALRRADDVWATTPVLAQQFARAAPAAIVPAGIASVPRVAFGDDARAPLVWAGRLDVDKRPDLFVEIARGLGVAARAYGVGPLAEGLRLRSGDVVEWAGWAQPAGLWRDASIFVGTSSREAFGRSAVEAACSGLPVVLSAAYGAAPLLFTDPLLRERCVIASDDPAVWTAAVRALLTDDALRRSVSDHVHHNARRLTIDASARQAASRAAATLAGVAGR